jgi:hypothetical protein
MPKNPATLTLLGHDEQHRIDISDIHYHGHGAYTCKLSIRSNGFACDKTFDFDNDEYFLAKLKEVLANKSAEAELMALQSDNYLKIQVFDADTLLVTGLILEEAPLTQALEFAFTTGKAMLERFVSEFSRMVKANT